MKSKEAADDRLARLRLALPTDAPESLAGLSGALSMLVQLGHERMTVRQALFFLAAAELRLAGQTATVPTIQYLHDVLGRSIEKSKDQFLEPTKRNPDALGWLEQEVDEDDRRMRFLNLTDEGAEVLAGVIQAASLS